MLSIAFLYRSLYDKAASPVELQANAQRLHLMASKQVQLDIRNPNLSPALKLSGIMEVLFYAVRHRSFSFATHYHAFYSIALADATRTTCSFNKLDRLYRVSSAGT